MNKKTLTQNLEQINSPSGDFLPVQTGSLSRELNSAVGSLSSNLNTALQNSPFSPFIKVYIRYNTTRAYEQYHSFLNLFGKYNLLFSNQKFIPLSNLQKRSLNFLTTQMRIYVLYTLTHYRNLEKWRKIMYAQIFCVCLLTIFTRKGEVCSF